MRSIGLSSRALAFCLAAFAAASAQPALYAGGGLHLTREDDAFDHHGKGLRALLGLQVAGDHLGLVLQGAFDRYASHGARATDSSLPRAGTRLFEAHLLPKFYLRRGDISAYFIGGGGPQWTLRETWTERSGSPNVRSTDTRMDLGMQWGFGVEANVTESMKVGLAPSFHTVYRDDERAFEYTSFAFYLMF